MSEENIEDLDADTYVDLDEEFNDGFVVAFCLGCLNTVPDDVAQRDIFLQRDHRGVHPGCGGPTIEIHPSQVEAVRRRRRAGFTI